jgi:hypothetical protein
MNILFPNAVLSCGFEQQKAHPSTVLFRSQWCLLGTSENKIKTFPWLSLFSMKVRNMV